MDNGDIQVDNRGWFWWFFFSYFSVNGSASCPKNDGKCWVTFNLSGDRPDTTTDKANYNVIDTDYDNYLIVYDCFNTWYGARQESAWIMTRKPVPDASYVKTLESVLKQKVPGYNQDGMTVSDQGEDNCTYV